MTNGDSLTPRQKAVAALMATGCSQKNAAQQCGVGENTVVKWAKTPEFRAEVRARQGELFSETVGVMLALTKKAVKSLSDICGDSTAPAAARISAANTILNFTADHWYSNQIEARLEVLEHEQEKSTEQTSSHRERGTKYDI